jgi:signal transduction histidine kinase
LRTRRFFLFGALSLPRQLALIVVLFLGIVGGLLCLANVGLGIMSGARAYVAGEGLWSKGQKGAIHHLLRYSDTHEESDWEQYRRAVAVPLGDRRARRELDRAHPDMDVVLSGFLEGRNHAEDVPMMAMLVRRFRRVGFVGEAVSIWASADRDIERLDVVAENLRAAITTDGAPPARMHDLRRKLEILDARLMPLEDAFSATLSDGARAVRRVLFQTILVFAALLSSVAVLLSAMIVHFVQRHEEARLSAEAARAAEGRVSAALARLGQELISALDTPVLYERLCQVTGDVLGCAAAETLILQPGADVYVRVASWTRNLDGERPAWSGPMPRETLSIHFRDDRDGNVAELEPGLLAIALRHGDEIVGVQLARAVRPDSGFTAVQRRIAAGAAQLGSLALANAQLVGELEKLNRLKSEFVSTMSHELRTPLNVILGYAEMARDNADERDDYLSRIDAAGRELLGLIETTLEVGRIEAGRDTITLEPVSLAAFLATIAAGCARLPRHESVVLTWPASPPDIVLMTDPRKLTLVLRNLVGNALKFTERGEVRVEAALDNGHVVLKVADTGIGIPLEDQEAIFEMFRQVDGSDRRRFGGSGLGLYIVQRFVRRLGGTIALASEPGRGSVFSVSLPRLAPAIQSDAA